MSHKKARVASWEEAASGFQPSPLNLQDEPARCAFVCIAHYSKLDPPHLGHPLLLVSKGWRAAVFQSLRRVELLIPPDWPDWERAGRDSSVTTTASCVKTLKAVCSQAPPGLHVGLSLHSWSNALPTLLQPGIDAGGWSKVHSLTVSCVRYRCQQMPVK
jgi:hypothetical protein